MISAYESGRREPTLPTLRRLVEATGHDLGLVLAQSSRPPRALSGPVGRRILAHRGELRRALAAHSIHGARVFGSAARGDDGAGSDVDLLVGLPDGMGLFTLGRLQRELEAIVGAPVDLVPEDGLKDHVRSAIENDLILL